MTKSYRDVLRRYLFEAPSDGQDCRLGRAGYLFGLEPVPTVRGSIRTWGRFMGYRPHAEGGLALDWGAVASGICGPIKGVPFTFSDTVPSEVR